MSKLKHCTEEDCQQVLDFMVAFSRLLGLHCWIVIKDRPAPRDAYARIVHREIELMVDQLALAWCGVAEVKALWYGDDVPITDPEAGPVAL